MKLDLSCPLELRGYTLSYTESDVQASVRLYNLTNRRIASFEAIAKWRSPDSDRGIAMPFCAERLRAGAENGFRITLTCDRLPDADRLDLVFTSVRFEDGSPDWRAGEGMIVDVAPIEPISAENLAALRRAAGEDAVCFPKQNAQTWRCVCGRVNPNGDTSCARCHREHEAALSVTREGVLAIGENSLPIREEKSDEMQLNEIHSQYLRHRNRLYRRTLATAIAVLALTVLLVLRWKPAETAAANAEVIAVYGQNTCQED